MGENPQSELPENLSSAKDKFRLIGAFIVGGAASAVAMSMFDRLVDIEVPTDSSVLILVGCIIIIVLLSHHAVIPLRWNTWWATTATTLIVLGITILVTQPKKNTLSPDDQPTPSFMLPNLCGIDPGQFLKIWAGKTVFIVPSLPYFLLRFEDESNFEDAFVLEFQDQNKSILFSAVLRESDGTLIARIENNVLVERGNGIPQWSADHHRLKIIDTKDDEVLDLEFINEKTIRVSGLFRFRNQNPTVLINEDGIFELSRNNTLLGTCVLTGSGGLIVNQLGQVAYGIY